MAGAQKEEPSDLSQGRVREVRRQWAVHEDGALAYQMQNEEITEHYGLNRFHRRMVREDIPVAKIVQSEEELQRQEERLRELEVLKIQAEEDAKLAKKISQHMKREGRNRGDYDNRHQDVREVRNRTNHEVRNRTDHNEVRNRTDHDEVRNCTDHDEVRNRTDHKVRNRTDHDEVRNRTDQEVINRRDQEVRNYEALDIGNDGQYQTRDHSVRNITDHKIRNLTDHEIRNHTDNEIKNHTDHEIRNLTDHEIRNRAVYEVGNHQEHVGIHGDHQIKSHTDHGVRNPTFHDVGNPTFHDVRNPPFHDVRNPMLHDVRNPTFQDVRRCTDNDVTSGVDSDVRNDFCQEARNSTDLDVRNHVDLDVRNHTGHEVRNRTGHEVRNRTGHEVRNRTDGEVLDDEELARQLQEKEQRKYERHLERKKEKKLKKDRQMLEAALAKDLEEARLAVNPESGDDGVSASMESLNLQGVSVTRVTAAGQIEDNGDFSDFYKLPDEMDEVTRMEIQASQDEELARLLQEQEHKRTKAKVDPEKMRRIELHDEQLARIIQEEEKLRMRKAKHKHQARKEARRLMSVESMPLGASANSLNQQKQSQGCLADIPPAAAPATTSGQHRYRSNSYTKACDSPPSPARSPARKHRASTQVGEIPEQPGIPSHESIAPSVGPDHKHQYYPNSLNEKQASTSSSTSSPSAAHSSCGKGLSTLETARQIAAGNPEGILAIQNSHKNTADRHRRTEQDRFMRSQEMLDVDRLPVQGQHMGRWARRGSDPYRPVTEVRGDAAIYALPYRPITEVRGDAAIYALPYKPPGVLLGSELRQLEVADVHGYLTDESGSSSGSVSRLSRLQQVHQYHHQQLLQQQQADSVSKEDAGPHLQPAPGGLAGFNIVAALDPTYQRSHPEACLLPEPQIQSQVPFSRSLPQADGELEWDPNLRGSLRKPKAQIHCYQDPTTTSSLGHENAVGGDPVMSSWQPVQGQRRRDPGTRGKAQQRNVSGADKKGNCKQQ